MKISNPCKIQPRKALTQVLDGDTAEFLLEKSKGGRLHVRVGQIWHPPKRVGSTILLLDYDNCKNLTREYRRKIEYRLKLAGVELLAFDSRRSPSGLGMHIAVYVAGKFNRYQIVALQALLESDPNREANNFKRASMATNDWDTDWNVLFQ